MSQILDRLKRAEQEREQMIAERRRLETEADAALAAHDREGRVQRDGRDALQPPPRPPVAPEPRATAAMPSWFGWLGWLVAAAAMLAYFDRGPLLHDRPVKDRPERPVATPQPEIRVSAPSGAFALRLDRDSAAFAARVGQQEKK